MAIEREQYSATRYLRSGQTVQAGHMLSAAVVATRTLSRGNTLTSTAACVYAGDFMCVSPRLHTDRQNQRLSERDQVLHQIIITI
jgi:hypothetical protein